jgi:hydrogenase maturation protease
MDAPPGTVRWIPWESADGIGVSTHTLPLRLLCEYLTASLGCRVDLLGIQPAGTELGAPLSEAARAGVETAASQLAELLRLPDLIAVPQEAYR